MKLRLLDYLIGAVALCAFFLLLIENTVFGDTYATAFSIANVGILLTFSTDVIYRFMSAKDRRAHLRRKWFDLIVFLPLIQYVPGIWSPGLFVVLRQVVIVVLLTSRSRQAGKLVNLLSLRPAQAMMVGFLGAIGTGSILLMLPVATLSGDRTSLVDAVFTATSAVCVTGLVVQDTATHFSTVGQLIILGLIQAGGLGIMTFSVSLVAFTAKQMDVRQRAALQDVLDYETLAGVRGVIRYIVLMTLGFETVGAVLLFVVWHGKLGGVWRTVFHAVFHSVSAFCNAGFSTFSDSLVRFRGDVATNVVISILIMAGGLGFMVVRDLMQGVGRTIRMPHHGRYRARVQTRIVLATTTLLIVAGAALVYVGERSAIPSAATGFERILLCVFQSVTTRTAGFNTMDIGHLTSATLLLTIVLMFIGGSPGSTAGGIKTTTVATLWAAVRGALRGREQAEMYRRTIPREAVQKAVTVLCFALVTVLGFAWALMCLEHKPFIDVLFETVSAFGTVGLSTGITHDLTVSGKVLIAALMYVGRLGPLTIAYALIRRGPAARYEYADERIMIG